METVQNLDVVVSEASPGSGVGHNGRRLTRSARAYFETLVAEYRLVATGNVDSPANALLTDLIEKNGRGELRVSDVRMFETALIALLPVSLLCRKLHVMRAAYRRLIDKERFDQYEKTNPPADESAGIEKLREDALFLATEINLHCSYAAAAEELQANLFATVSVSTFATCLIVLAIGYAMIAAKPVKDGSPPPGMLDILLHLPCIVFAMVAGACGAFVSSVRRIQELSADAPAVNPLVERSGVFSAALPPLVGAIAAMALFVIFASHLLEGRMFPTIKLTVETEKPVQQADEVAPTAQRPDSTPVSKADDGKGSGDDDADAIWNVFLYLQSVNAFGENIGKLLLWSFISGFSERFVPDVLDWLTAKARPTKEPAAEKA